MKRQVFLLLLLSLLLWVAPAAFSAQWGKGTTYFFDVDATQKDLIYYDNVVMIVTDELMITNVTYQIPPDLLEAEGTGIREPMFYFYREEQEDIIACMPTTHWIETLNHGQFEPVPPPGELYRDYAQWPPVQALGETVIVRPYFPALDAWGEPLTLRVRDAKAEPFP